MRNLLRKNRILSLVLLATVFLSACSFASSDTGSDENTVSIGSDDANGSASGSENLVSSAVDFDHELDNYEPKKNHYNFYFTYKTVHPWWDAVALGMEDAQRQYLEKGITVTYEYMAPEAASADDQKKRLSEAKERF